MDKHTSILKRAFDRYLLKALSFMALGLFSSLIIGLIISQISMIPGLGFLDKFADIISASSPVVGSAIGVAIAYGLSTTPLVIFSSAATGAFGYMLGGPVGAYVAAVVGCEFGNLVAGKTKLDIILIPIVTIITGCTAGEFIGPGVSQFMDSVGSVINTATQLHPFTMGITVAVIMGLCLTAPISSAAIAISLNLSGLAAGAATVGCAAQMIGFAVISYKENGMGGFISQGLGTSMLQISNIVKHPQILIPPTLAGAILGPVSTVLFKMSNNAMGAGMGTSGFVGQFGTWATMSETVPAGLLLAQIVILQFIAPAILSLAIYYIMLKQGWIKSEYLKLNL